MKPTQPSKDKGKSPISKPEKTKSADSTEKKRKVVTAESPKPTAKTTAAAEKYGAPHGNDLGNIWVLDLCEKVINKDISIQQCINQYEDHLNLKPPVEIKLTEKELKSPARERKKYTEENIEKAIEEMQIKPFSRFNQKKLNIIYNQALSEILSYLKKQGEEINSHDNFYLNILLSSINNRLGNVKESIKYDEKARSIYAHASSSTSPEDQWASKLSPTNIDTLFTKRLEKHSMQVSGPVYKQKTPGTKTSPEKALALKTYYPQEITKFLEKLDMIEIFKTFRSKNASQFTKAILDLNALDSLEHSHFGIYVRANILKSAAQGYYDSKNKVVIGEMSTVAMKETILHELIHKALDRVFNNDTIPYSKDNVVARKAYHECMREVFLNLIDAIFPLDKLEKLKDGEKCYVQNSKGERIILIFPHKWSRLMPLDELIENCFGSYRSGIFFYQVSFYFDNAYIEGEYGQKIWSKAGNYSKSNFTVSLIQSLKTVFSGDYYTMSAVDSEFVTQIAEYSLRPEYKGNKIVKPLEDFLAKYVMPEMQAYIDEHPRKNQIKEKIVENDTSYSTALINAATLSHLQYVGPLLILLFVIYAFIDWSLVNATLGRS